jgi:hypothetical protein
VALIKTDVSEERIVRVVLHNMLQLIVTTKIVPSSPILVNLMIEEMRSSETFVLKEQHGVTTENIALFIVTVLKT